jgi:hypothetical protein
MITVHDRCYHGLGATKAASSSLSIGDRDVIVT